MNMYLNRNNRFVYTAFFFLVVGIVQRLLGRTGAFDIQLHDTYLVISLVHVYWTFSLMFFLFAGIYWCFSTLLKVDMKRKLRHWHFWCSAILPVVILAFSIDQLVLTGAPHLFESGSISSLSHLLIALSLPLFAIGQLIFISNLLSSLIAGIRPNP